MNQFLKKMVKNGLTRKKVRLLLGKFGAAEHEKYVNSILPRQSGEVTFRETIQILMKIFGEQSSLFNTHWKCQPYERGLRR